MTVAILCLCLAQAEPHAALLPTGEIREAIQELREVRKANQAVAAESREWRTMVLTFLDRLDGHRLAAIWQALTTAMVGLYRIVLESLSTAKYLAVAVIALCAVRGLREVSDAIRPWFRTPTPT